VLNILSIAAADLRHVKRLGVVSLSPSNGGSAVPQHIDVISNEPLAGRQKLLARLSVERDGVAVDAGDDRERGDRVIETLRQIVPDVDPAEDPDGFVAAVQERVDYTYLAIGALHDDDECPFGHPDTEITGLHEPDGVPSAQPA